MVTHQGFIQRLKDARNSILIVIIFLLSTLIAQFNHSFEIVPSIIIILYKISNLARQYRSFPD